MKEVTIGDAGYHTNAVIAEENEEETGIDLKHVMENFANVTTADREAFQ